MNKKYFPFKKTKKTLDAQRKDLIKNPLKIRELNKSNHVNQS